MTIKIIVADRVAFAARGTITGETGAAEAFEFRVTAKRLTEQGLRDSVNAPDRDTTAFLADVVVGWAGVLDDEGNEVPYSPQALRQLCGNCLGLSQIVFEAYLDAVRAKAKN